jgi:hypothetical protein
MYGKTLWASFVIDAPGGRIYFVTDSGYRDGGHFRRARERHGPFRLAILSILAVCKRCGNGMKAVVEIAPFGTHPGLIAFVCDDCGATESRLLYPLGSDRRGGL